MKEWPGAKAGGKGGQAPAPPPLTLPGRATWHPWREGTRTSEGYKGPGEPAEPYGADDAAAAATSAAAYS